MACAASETEHCPEVGAPLPDSGRPASAGGRTLVALDVAGRQTGSVKSGPSAYERSRTGSVDFSRLVLGSFGPKAGSSGSFVPQQMLPNNAPKPAKGPSRGRPKELPKSGKTKVNALKGLSYMGTRSDSVLDKKHLDAYEAEPSIPPPVKEKPRKSSARVGAPRLLRRWFTSQSEPTAEPGKPVRTNSIGSADANRSGRRSAIDVKSRLGSLVPPTEPGTIPECVEGSGDGAGSSNSTNSSLSSQALIHRSIPQFGDEGNVSNTTSPTSDGSDGVGRHHLESLGGFYHLGVSTQNKDGGSVDVLKHPHLDLPKPNLFKSSTLGNIKAPGVREGRRHSDRQRALSCAFSKVPERCPTQESDNESFLFSLDANRRAMAMRGPGSSPGPPSLVTLTASGRRPSNSQMHVEAILRGMWPQADDSYSPIISAGHSPLLSAAHSPEDRSPHGIEINPQLYSPPSGDCRLFSAAELDEATGGWAKDNILGKGSFGTVFKGTLAGKEVAVKRLEGKGKHGTREYGTEVLVLSHMRHPNLVQLVGHCLEAHCLVYEYLPGGSLKDRLARKGVGANLEPMTWQERVQTMAEVASGLAYLHSADPSVVHRDLKPENILFDADGTPKVSDVGIARLMEEEDQLTFTVSGTAGYIDPEFMATFRISPLSDVYALGLIMLQLITGIRSISKVHQLLGASASSGCPRLVSAVAAQVAAVADSTAGSWPMDIALELAVLAIACAQRQQHCRPDLIQHVLPTLQAIAQSTKDEFLYGVL